MRKYSVAGDQKDVIKCNRGLSYIYLKMNNLERFNDEIEKVNKIQYILENKRESIQNRLLYFTFQKQQSKLN